MAALTVPGAIGGWKIALELSAAIGGRLPLISLVERAASQAREGVAVSASEQRSQPRDGGALYDAPNFRSAYFIDAAPPKAGAHRKQTKLGDTLAISPTPGSTISTAATSRARSPRTSILSARRSPAPT